MIITIPEVEEQFNKWNGIIFNDELPTPHFELMQTKSLLGQFCPRWVLGEWTYKIRISTFYDRPFESYVDTIVHEMLHYWIKYKGIKDTSSHGKQWKKYAAEISKKYGLTITRTNPAGGGVSEKVLEKRKKNKVQTEIVLLCKLIDGKYGASVVPQTKVSKFLPRVSNWKYIKEFRFVTAPWNKTYQLRHLRTACGIRTIKKEIYDELIQYPTLRV